jgi:hypothetical protein
MPELRRQVIKTTPVAILQVNPRADKRLAKIAERAMERELRDRYATMADIIKDLKDLEKVSLDDNFRLTPEPEPIVPAPPGPLSSELIGYCLAAVAIVTVLVLASDHDGFGQWLYAGNLDPTYKIGRTDFTNVSKFSGDSGKGLLIEPDAKIVVGGLSSWSGRRNFAIARYHPDGSLDGNFGSGGKFVTDLGSDAEAADIALHPYGTTPKAVLTTARRLIPRRATASARTEWPIPTSSADTRYGPWRFTPTTRSW